MSHNSATADVVTAQAVQPDLPFRLTGSQAKTKRCIEMNLAQMVEEAGLEHVIFGTLTVGDEEGGRFVQTADAAEGSRRINNLARRFLPSLFSRWVLVTERHKSGAIHYHIAAELRQKVDVRTGYDWAAVRSGDYRSACPALRQIWALLRRELPAFGFGRAQVEPWKGAESAARYVAKYVEKNLFARTANDHRKKLVRYGGWGRQHVKPNDWSWATPRAAAFRQKAAKLGAMIGAKRETIATAIGPRWAWVMKETMNLLNDQEPGLTELRPMLSDSDFPVRMLATRFMREKASSEWLRKWDARRSRLPFEWRMAA